MGEGEVTAGRLGMDVEGFMAEVEEEEDSDSFVC